MCRKGKEGKFRKNRLVMFGSLGRKSRMFLLSRGKVRFYLKREQKEKSEHFYNRIEWNYFEKNIFFGYNPE